jgi:broad specificity phosphatase PhoE
LSPRIVLVRHGRSAHVARAAVDRAGFLRWMEAYDLAGLIEQEAPPDELRALASDAYVVSSDIVRARLSAELLTPDVALSPLLRETQLVIPGFGGLRLPMRVWALAIGLRMALGAVPGERERAADAARWLVSLAAQHGTVLAVTHGAVRRYIADALIADGWNCRYPRRQKWSHWGAWELTPRQ